MKKKRAVLIVRYDAEQELKSFIDQASLNNVVVSAYYYDLTADDADEIEEFINRVIRPTNGD